MPRRAVQPAERSPKRRKKAKKAKKAKKRSSSSSDSSEEREEAAHVQGFHANAWAGYWATVAYSQWAQAYSYSRPTAGFPHVLAAAASSAPTEAPASVSTFLDGGIEEVVEVPRSEIARVIGKRGRTIAEVRSKSGAWKVDVQKAKELIRELSRPMSERYAGQQYVDISQGQIGKVIGTKGARVLEIERQTGVKIDVDYSRAPCRVFLTGSDAQVRLTKRLLQEIANEH
ncbi:unnamed protein product [Durusdinium trenchii]|uniref:K Homology domain-containing protein n=1 Tax=Durusdinium trenchii TaxID=1381693 RepID=A0ABP0S206_9DINO